MPKAVTPIIPANTAMPIAWRISAPAPVEYASGSTPMMKAIEVMMIGRSRSRLAGELDDQDRVLRREAHQHHEADLGEDVVVAVAEPHAGQRGAQRKRHDE